MNAERRDFLKASVVSAAALCSPFRPDLGAQTASAEEPPADRATPGRMGLVDTNIHVFDWPFRRLPYARTAALVEKLRRHGVQQAWAGTFEGVLGRDLGAANARLAEECRREGAGLLVPMGSVNPLLPDWEDDLRRCHEVHRMPGVRLHPGYHNYALDHPQLAALLRRATERQLLVQIALEMEDPRMQHPLIKAPTISPMPLVALLRALPDARVQLLNSWAWARQAPARALFEMRNVSHDIAGLEGVGAVRRMLDGKHWYLGGQVQPEQVLFGSHAPYFPVEATLLRLFESPLTALESEAIMASNANRLIPGAGRA